jgi:hypothetical protein
MRRLRGYFLVVDIGFIIYWICAALDLFPPAYLFKDYENPILRAWNFSFLPLDLLVSATGISSIICHRKGNWIWEPLALCSLMLTFSSGIQAIAFWALRSDFDLTWWLPNLFLMVYPLFFCHGAMRRKRTSSVESSPRNVRASEAAAE